MTGNNHDRTSALLTPIAAIALAQLYPTGQGLWLSLIGYTVGWLFLSPDLDLPRSNPKRRWGLLGFIWIPYDQTHKHRGRSHWPLFGSLERLAYLALPVGIAAWFINAEAAKLAVEQWHTILPLWTGIELACLWHLCCDWMPGLRKF
jgi:uncharacterized metal-binding protein